MVGLFSLRGIEAVAVEGGSLSGDTFCAFLQESVLPLLRRGDCLVLDNARCHRVKKVKELVESAGATLVYLPAYSPDFSPIELAWRKVKAFLRRAGARTSDRLREAIAEAAAGVGEEDGRAFFKHCGYQTEREAAQCQ